MQSSALNLTRGKRALSGMLREEDEEGNSEEEERVRATVLAIVQEYLAVAASDASAADLTPATPLMEAGLDSLDLLKVVAFSSNM